MEQMTNSTKYFQLFGSFNLNSAVKENENGAGG